MGEVERQEVQRCCGKREGGGGGGIETECDGGHADNRKRVMIINQ